jgi:uncharacterized membrane protein YccC
MDQYGFSMTALHKFLDTARTYFDLARKQSLARTPQFERRTLARLQASPAPAQRGSNYRENATA